MSIPLFDVVPSSRNPLTFQGDMDDLLSKLNPWTEALNAKGSAFALGVSATSATLLDFTPGIKNLTVQTGKGFVPGMDLVLADSAVPTNRMLTTCKAYNVETGALQVEVYSSTGTGTPSNWSISMTAAVDAAAFVTPTGIQTLTNKTLESAALTGNPTTPTAAPGTNSTRLANTAFVQNAVSSAISSLLGSAPAALDTLNELAAALGNDANFAATTAAAIASKAPLASPALTGVPTAPTAASGTNTTQLATTAFVQQAITSGRLWVTFSGAIAKGKAAVINSDGTASQVSYLEVAGALSAEQTFAASSVQVFRCYNIPGTNQVVMAYTGYLIVGTVNDSDVTWGAPVAFAYGATCDFAWHETEGKLVVFYLNGTQLNGAVGTLTGNALALSAAVTADTNASFTVVRCTYNQHQNRLMAVVSLAAGTSSTGPYLTLWTLSGATLAKTNGLSVPLGTSNTVGKLASVCNIVGTPRVLLVSNYISGSVAAAVLTINADTVSLGTAPQISTSQLSGVPAQLLPTGEANKYCVLVCSDTSSYSVLTVSGTTVTASTSTSWSTISGNSGIHDAVYDVGKGKLVLFGQNNGTDNYATVWNATLSGNTITPDTGTVINTTATTSMRCTYASGGIDRLLLAFQDPGDSNYGHTRVWDSGDSVTNANAWVGLAEANVADGGQGWLAIKGGIHSGQVGLTPGYLYYVDDTGSLQQMGTRVAGRAVSATAVLLTGDV